MIFKTKRLFVRELKREDFTAFYKMQKDPTVMKYVGGPVNTKNACIKDLDHLIGNYNKKDCNFYVWAVLNSTCEFVGTCAFIVNDNNENEIGYRFLKQYWGNGYGKEIVDGLINYALNNMKIEILYAYVDKKIQLQ